MGWDGIEAVARIEGITVSMMARRVVHCEGVKYPSDGPSGRAVARGAMAESWAVVMLEEFEERAVLSC